MAISRRALLRRIGAIAASTAVVPSLEASPNVPIRLNRNENAYGPSARAIAAIQETARASAHRYPQADAEALRNKIADLHRVQTDQVVLGCGAGEILRMAVDASVGPHKKLIVALPTFELIGDYARHAGAQVVAVPLTSMYSHDLDAMLARSGPSAGLVYICNPNNPTGGLTRRQDLEAFFHNLPATTCVLIDEAYHHYVGISSDYASFIDRPVDDHRVIVVRSFSKIHGLAGLRVGYAVAAGSTARRLASCALADDVNVAAARAAIAALDDAEHLRSSVRRNDDDRQEFFNQANARMLRAIDSRTNFVMLNTERRAVEVIEHFRKNGVLLPPPFPGFDAYVRVSMGTPAEMREFWRVWDLAPTHHSL